MRDIQNVWNKTNEKKFIKSLLLDPYSNTVINSEEVAKKFNVSANSVLTKSSRLRKAGLLPQLRGTEREINRLYSKREDSAIKSMTSWGLSCEEIGRELGRTKQSVRNRRRILNIRVHYRWTDQEINIIKENIKYDCNYIVSNHNELMNLIAKHSHSGISHKVTRLREDGDIPKPLKAGPDQAYKEWYKKYHWVTRS